MVTAVNHITKGDDTHTCDQRIYAQYAIRVNLLIILLCLRFPSKYSDCLL